MCAYIVMFRFKNKFCRSFRCKENYKEPRTEPWGRVVQVRISRIFRCSNLLL